MDSRTDRDRRLGDLLFELARMPEVDTALEVGDLRGDTPTYRIACGLAETGGRLYSVEHEHDHYLEALRFYSERRLPVEIVRAAHTPRDGVLYDLVERLGGFDLVFLDGGDSAADAEFDLLEPHTRRFVAIHGTSGEREARNAGSRRRLLEDPEWHVIVDAVGEGDGWLVARRVAEAAGGDWDAAMATELTGVLEEERELVSV